MEGTAEETGAPRSDPRRRDGRSRKSGSGKKECGGSAGRYRYLIENSIYGVDIEPIACQIAKLRFFIALLVDQKVNPKSWNFGVRPLPNLETRIVAADSLTPIEKFRDHQMFIGADQVKPLRDAR
jgi:hypothetical protein